MAFSKTIGPHYTIDLSSRLSLASDRRVYQWEDLSRERTDRQTGTGARHVSPWFTAAASRLMTC